MNTLSMLVRTVQTMKAVENNTVALHENIGIVIDKWKGFLKDANGTQDAFNATAACFTVLIKNVQKFIEAEMNLINENKKNCLSDLTSDCKEDE